MSATDEIRLDSTCEHCEETTLIQKGRRALHDGRRRAADALHRTASAMDDTAQRVHVPAAHKAAQKLHDAASYVGSHGASDMKAEVARYMRQHPGGFLAAAAAAGFIFGRMMLPDKRRRL
jgi:hypothetical protein